MSVLETEMSPINGEVSNSRPGTLRLSSPLQDNNIIVTDETALRTVVNSEINEKVGLPFNCKLFTPLETFEGLDPVIQDHEYGPFGRIPTGGIDERGNFHGFFDLRKKGNDQEPIEVGYVKSLDGCKTFVSRKVIGKRYSRTNGNGPSDKYLNYSRVMDPTFLDAGNGRMFVLCGRWLEGSGNWTNSAETYDTWEAALMLKTTDYGSNWTQNTIGKEQCTTKEGSHIVVQGIPSTVKGFLGGINPGIKTHDGKLVFAIQFTEGNGTVYCTILYSSDNGNTWNWGAGKTPNGTYEPCIFQLPDNRIVLHCRGNGGASSTQGGTAKSAYVCADTVGTSWEQYNPLHGKLGASRTGAGTDCEGGSICVDTISGNRITIMSYPQNDGNANLGVTGGYGRNQITLYAYNLDGKLKPLEIIKYEAGVRIDPSTPVFGGYSSIIYSQCRDGEYLLVMYEDAGGISLRNYSRMIPRAELFCNGFAKSSDIATTVEEKANELLPGVAKPLISAELEKVVKTKLNKWPSDFINFIDVHNVTTHGFDVIGSNLEKTGTLAISGQGFVEGSALKPAAISASEYVRGFLKVKYENNGVQGVVRGNIIQLTGDVITVGLGLFIPHNAIKSDWCPIVRFFDHETNTGGGNVKGGFEVDRRMKLYITGTGSTPICVLPSNKLINLIVEYTATHIYAYIDGVKAGEIANASALAKIKASINMCLAAQGEGKTYEMHVGSVSMFGRKLTTDEMKNIAWVNGMPLGDSADARSDFLEEIVYRNEDNLKQVTGPEKVDAIYLKNLLGPSKLFNIPLTYQNTNGYNISTVDEYMEVVNTQSGNMGNQNFKSCPKIDLSKYYKAMPNGFVIKIVCKLPVENPSTSGDFDAYFSLFGLNKGSENMEKGISVGLEKGGCNANKLKFDMNHAWSSSPAVVDNIQYASNADNAFYIAVKDNEFRLFLGTTQLMRHRESDGRSLNMQQLNTLTLGGTAQKQKKVKIHFKSVEIFDGWYGNMISFDVPNEKDFNTLNIFKTGVVDELNIPRPCTLVNPDLLDWFDVNTFDKTGTIWEGMFNGINLDWDNHSAVTMEKQASSVSYNNNGGTNKQYSPKINLAKYLQHGDGLTLALRVKFLDISSLAQYPSLFSITRKNSEMEAISVGLTKASSSSNLQMNFHIKNDFTSNSISGGDYQQYDEATTSPSNDFKTVFLTIKNSEVKIYLETQCLATKTVTGTVADLDTLTIGVSSRFAVNPTKFEVEHIGILRRGLEEAELANYVKICKPAWYRVLESKSARP